MKKRITSLLLTLAMLLSLVPALGVTASAAEEGDWTEVGTYEELYDAFRTGKSKIRLKNSIDTRYINDGGGVTTETQLKVSGDENITLDLNGMTLRMHSEHAKVFYLISVQSGGSLTIQSGNGQGKLYLSIGQLGSCSSIVVSNGGDLTVDNVAIYGSDNYRNKTLIKSTLGNVTIQNSELFMDKRPDYTYTGHYCLHAKLGNEGNSGRVIVNNSKLSGVVGLDFGAVSFSQFQERVKLTDVTMNAELFIEGWSPTSFFSKDRTWYLPMRINSGTFNKIHLDYCASYSGHLTSEADENIKTFDKFAGEAMAYLFAPNGVVLADNKVLTANASDMSQLYWWDHFSHSDKPQWAGGNITEPVISSMRVYSPDQFMQSVTLDDEKIEWGKDWKSEVHYLDNGKAHNLTFTWAPLPREMQNAGYSYQIRLDKYTPGSSVQKENISGSATEHTVDLAKDAAAGFYSYDLHLNLKKGDTILGASSNEHIVRILLKDAPEPDPALTGRVYHPSAIVYGRPISTAITGLPEGLGESGLSYQWQRQRDSGAWQDISGATGKSYTPTEDDLGENVRIRVTATAAGYLGKLAGASLTVSKEVQDREPVTPEVRVSEDPGHTYTSFNISSGYQNDQEYVYSTTQTEGWPTGSDVKKVSDYGLVDGLTNGQTYYLYTRLKETKTHKAGSKVICKTVFMGDPMNLTKLVLKNDGVPYADYGKGNIIFVKKGGSVTLEVGTNPSGANQWNAYKFKTLSAETSSYYTVKTSNGTNEVPANEKITSITITGTAPGRDDLVAEYSGHTPQYYGSWQVLVYEDLADIDGHYIRFETTPSAFPDMTLDKGQSVALPAYEVSTFPEGTGDAYRYEWRVNQMGEFGSVDYVKDNGYLAVSEDGTTLTAKAAHGESAGESDKTVVLCAVKGTEVIPLVSYQATVEEEPEITLTDIILSHEQLRLKTGETFQLHAARVPANASGTFKWESINPTIATVDDNGLVIAVSQGLATIEVTDEDTGVNKTCEVLVDHTEHDYDGQDWITLDPANHEMVCNQCGDYKTEPHTFTAWQKVDDTTHQRTCTVCKPRASAAGAVYTQNANHNWQWVTTVEATLTTPGTQVLQCAQCGAVKPGSETSLPVLQSINVENLYAAAPVVDMPAEMAVANDITHYVASTQWMDPAGNALNMDEAFKPNTVYSAKIILEAVDGYVFTASTTYNAIGGKTPQVLSSSADQVILNYTFDKTGNSSSGGGTTGGGGGGGGGVTTYDITVKDAKNGDVSANRKSAAKGTTVTLTAKPDKGYVLDTISVLDSKNQTVKLTAKDGKFTFPMPASAVTVKASFKAQAPSADHPFTDVPGDSWFEDAVIWAVDKGITGGTSATTFSPNGICTRAQAVTFLWRAAGSPAPKSSAMPFTDVPAGSWYYDAVLWAVEQGITAGTSATTFAPDLNCSRAQIVTFLYRAAGSPAVSGSPAFSDVAPDAYYAKAVKWAQANGITSGIGGGLFGSNDNCTRAQIVTFIWRALAE